MSTLNDALQECARNTYNTKVMVRTATGYVGKGLAYAERFLSGINYAINKVCRERLGVLYTEDVVLDENGQFPVSSLANTCIKIREIIFDSTISLPFQISIAEICSVENYDGATVSVTYEAIPPELLITDLDVQLPVDPRYVDMRVICQYANYQFLSEEGTSYDSARAETWLGLFNNSFAEILHTNSRQRRVRYTG